MKDSAIADKITKDIGDGNASGVNSTPTFFVNGKKLKFNSIAEIRSGIEAALEEAKNK
jgi:protein-disulfide isomerase